MIMFKGVRLFVRVSLTILCCCAFVAIAYAANPPAANIFEAKDIIMVLLGLLQTIFMGVGVWLIANDKELFTRLGNVESKVATRDAICDERWDGGHHPQRRSTDYQPNGGQS